MCKRVFVVVVLAGIVLATAGQAPLVRLQAASAQPAAVSPSRELLDRYCVTCHNARLQTAGLALDRVDLAQVAVNAEVLEKVVHKLRTGQMPPEGRPRPDDAVVDAFATSLETALDRAAVDRPNPGRVASRRLNRLEYVNVIEDLLGLEVNGEELLPSDMAGFGFDNNADVLSITPSLMARYIAAATKISRAAIGSPDNRPVMQLYQVGFERRDARAGEEMPFGTHGGLAVRHHFPLDGDYVFAIRLKRNDTIETIDGIAETEHQIEVRIDHALVEQFAIGGKFPGPDPGQLIAPAEDDVDGQRLHEYRMTADRELEIRVPVQAGTRLVSVAFTDSAPSPHPAGALPGIDKFFVSGPFDGTVPADGVAGSPVLVVHGVGLGQGEGPDFGDGGTGHRPVVYTVDGMGQVHRGGSGVPNPVGCPVENLENFGEGLSCLLVESDHQAVGPTGSDGWSTPYRESRDGVDNLVDRTQPDYP